MLKFSLNSTGFNLQNAYNCCLLSKAAYLPVELIGHQLKEEWGMSELKKFSNQNCKGFIASSDQVTVMSFTGSEFEILLRNLGRHVLILAGLATNFGIEMTARSANERDYGVVVLSDCTDRMLGEYSELTLSILLPYYGRVMTSETLRAEFDAQDPKNI